MDLAPHMKFDHIGIVAQNLAVGRASLSATLGIGRWTEEFADSGIGVYVQFGLDQSGICYELVAPLGEHSPVAKTLDSGRNILNHIAYLVPDLAEAAKKLKAARAVPTGPQKPAVAYGGRQVQFFLMPLRFIVELIEAPGHMHIFNFLPEPH